MRQSKAGKTLNPIIAALTAPIYEYDPIRYRRLILWVWTQQQAGWPDEAIAKALELAKPHIHQASNWWPYLTKLLPKAKAQAVATESDQYKKSDLTSLKSILREIVK